MPDPQPPELNIESLTKHPSLVLQAPPGWGKTTRVPPALLHAPFLDSTKEVLILEPRRLAAKMSARRVAQLMGEPVGQTVGYQFRFENVSGPKTRLRFLTEGMLMRRLISDPTLSGVSAVVLDEFHERHLHSDVALAFLRMLQREKRPDLRIVVMSATLDAAGLADFLGAPGAPAPIFQATHRQFEVSVEYLPSPPAKHLDLTVKDGVLGLLDRTQGDFLVFLPGMAEIRRCTQALEPVATSRGLVLTPLHGELSREEQDAAIQPLGAADKRRKVILATNVAETSLTIPGVGVVVDSGLHRQASHSWWSGVPALRTRPISRASAIQRTGRAGRTGPGHCLRLYTRGDFEGRAMFDAPEIQRADLTQTVLELGMLGVPDASAFPWFEAPQAQALDASRGLLERLGAWEQRPDGQRRISELGRRMVQVPAHPRLSRMMIEAERQGVVEDAATLAACIMEGRLSSSDGRPDGMYAMQSLKSVRMEESIWRVRTHLLGPFTGSSRGPRDAATAGSAPAGRSKEDRLRYALLCGFPDRVARKRADQDPNAADVELLLASGGSVRIPNSAEVTGSDTFVILDLQEKQHAGQTRGTTRVQSLCEIQVEWLFDLEPACVSEVDEAVWDEARGRVRMSSKLTYDQLVLSESRSDLNPDSPAAASAAALMLKKAFGVDAAKANSLSAHDWVQALASTVEPQMLEGLLTRISWIAKHFPEYELVDLIASPYDFGPLVLKALQGRSSLLEIKEMDWEQAILSARGTLAPHQLEELTPTSLTLPSGRRARVQYTFSQPPWVESRLQDFFGMKKGPSILKGRVPLTLHLLAPNGRAVQVTTDLEGFWKRAYPELRHALSRRYPRHSWPENP